MKFLQYSRVLIVLSVCAVFTTAYGATIPDGYDEPIYDLGDGTIRDAEHSQMTSSVTIHKGLEPIQELAVEEAPVRARRFSCDVLSFQSKWVSPNHSACAVRCLAQRRKGGKCENGVCVCRGNKWGK